MTLEELHPVVVHFPVALFIVGFLLDAVGIALKREALFEAASWCLGIGAIGALTAAFIAHAHLDQGAGEDALATLENHELGAYVTISLALFAGAIRGYFAFRARQSRALRYISAFALLAVALSVGVTGFFGGELTHGGGHEHGESDSNETTEHNHDH
ncbi:MAG: hypothetical protein NUW37_13430 [Planctomycetes bacterium]|nr:hypothetical protein [Planctomycetota bacterium]